MEWDEDRNHSVGYFGLHFSAFLINDNLLEQSFRVSGTNS